ncbi:hypothetical protein EMPS_04906 [Entomortierella parvispora]|uniref:Uncharacterized protein n=1 Tax=Entomortierella parvispora TaxID=205924 RepID=A0A9P3LVX8_9FUNG|nr:hypothetical protein EMPS_04906 [Entomortierella parvispora]
MYSKKHSATAAVILAVYSAMRLVQADRVFLIQPNSTDIYPGCSVDLGYRVRYSDMAMLEWVQLQVLAPNSDVLVESVDYATRAELNGTTRSGYIWVPKIWKAAICRLTLLFIIAHRVKNLSWAVPSDWAPGDYIVRAFGNATHPCTDQSTGHRTRCGILLEDRETLHLQPLVDGQGCQDTSVPPPSTTASDNEAVKSEDGNTPVGENAPLDSSNSYMQQNKDALNKNLAATTNNTLTPSMNQTLEKEHNLTSSNDANSNNGTEGYSTELRIVLDQATVQRRQEQQILQILNEAQDYSLTNSTVTMEDGSVKPMDELMDKATMTRFLQTLDQTNSTLVSTTNTTHQGESSNPARLLQILHNNSSLIAMAPPLNTTDNSVLLNHNGTKLDAGSPGRGLAQQPDRDQIQDKSKENGASTTGRWRGLTGSVLLATSLSAWMLQ